MKTSHLFVYKFLHDSRLRLHYADYVYCFNVASLDIITGIARAFDLQVELFVRRSCIFRGFSRGAPTDSPGLTLIEYSSHVCPSSLNQQTETNPDN